MTEHDVSEPLDGTAMLAALGVHEEAADEDSADEDVLVAEPGSSGNGQPLPDAPPSVVEDPPVFTVQRAVLAAMVEQVMLAVPSRDYYPALKSIVLDVSEDSLTLTGSNSALTVVSTSLVVRTERPGRILVPGGKFAAVVRSVVGHEVRLSATASTVHITAGGGSWTLRASSTQDYPAAPALGDLAWVEVNRTAFDRAVAGTRYAAGSDEQRDHFMQLDFSGGSAVATDGVRYSQVNAELPAELSVQVATAGVDLLSKMLANNDADQFRVADSAYHTVVEIGPAEAPDRAVIAHLMRPLPGEARNAIAGPRGANRDRCCVDAADLLAVLNRAKPTLDSETGAVLLRVAAEELTVESRNRYGDSSVETVECHFTTVGSDRSPKPRSVSVVRDHLAKAVAAAQRGTLRSSVADDEDDEEVAEPVEVELLLGEDRSKTRLAPVLVQGTEGNVQAVLSQVRSEWVT